MSYYAPFYQPMNYYNRPMQNGLEGQNISPTPILQQPNYSQPEPMIWVLNQNEADSYPVAPNCTVTLWDKNHPVIYLKSMSANGMPSMRILDYSERQPQTNANAPVSDFDSAGDKFATKDQLNALQSAIDGLKSKIDNLNTEKAEEKPKTAVKKVAKDREVE